MITALAAIANKAALLDKEHGYLVCGVRDDRIIVGLEQDDGDRKVLADRLQAYTDPTVEVDSFDYIGVDELDATMRDTSARGVLYVIRVRRARYWPHRIYLEGKGQGKYGTYPCRYGPTAQEIQKEHLATLFLTGARRYLADTGESPAGISPEIKEALEGLAKRFGREPKVVAHWLSPEGKWLDSIRVEPDYLVEEVEYVDPDSPAGIALKLAQVPSSLFGMRGSTPPRIFVPLKVALANEGSDVAVNVTAFFEFPEDCELTDSQQYSEGLTMVFSGRSWSGLSVQKGTQEVQCSAQRITNGLVSQGFDPVYVKFPAAGSYTIKTSCYADGMDRSESVLTVEVVPKRDRVKIARLKPEPETSKGP